jgi:hypothetical protein
MTPQDAIKSYQDAQSLRDEDFRTCKQALDAHATSIFQHVNRIKPSSGAVIATISMSWIEKIRNVELGHRARDILVSYPELSEFVAEYFRAMGWRAFIDHVNSTVNVTYPLDM